MVGNEESIRGWELLALTAILVAAFALRVWRLNDVPPGLTHDEANNVADAVSVLRGARPLYFPVAQGKEPLYLYTTALTMALMGPSPLALRVTSMIWGVLLVLLTYVWARQCYGPSAALWSAVGLATSFWGVSTSRLGLRAVALPVLLTAAFVILSLPAPRRLSVIRSVTGGVCLGLTFYTYLAARVMPALFVLFGLYLILVDPPSWRKAWSHGLVVLSIAAIVAAPMFVYLRQHPSASIRLSQLDRPLRDLLSGNPGPLLVTMGRALQVFSVRGDGFVPYNIPGRPLLNPLLSVLFYGGLLVAVRRWREPAYAFALMWLVVGFFPALATGRDAANLRAIAAQPVTFLFPALALEEFRTACRSRFVGIPVFTVITVGFLVVGAETTLTIRDYFVRWPNRQDVRVHYHTDLKAIAEALERRTADLPVGISTLYPGEYHDPRIVDAVLTRRDPPLRWFDGRQSLVLPSSSTAELILPAVPSLDGSLWEFVRPYATLAQRVEVRPDDFNAWFDVYRWTPQQTREDVTVVLSPAVEPLADSVDVGGVLQFRGYRLRGWTGETGSASQVLSLWDVVASLPEDRHGVLFVQLLDTEHRVIAQDDELGVPSWNWHPGDSFVQLHNLTLPAGAEPGEYVLIAGAYTTPDRVDAIWAGHEPDPSMPRLPVYQNGERQGDAITLLRLEIE